MQNKIILEQIDRKKLYLKKAIEYWLEKNGPPCSCDEAYKGRRLTAPDCLRHRGLDSEDLVRMIEELKSSAALDEPNEEGKLRVDIERRKFLFECMMGIIHNQDCRRRRNCICPDQCEAVETEICELLFGNPALGKEE